MNDFLEFITFKPVAIILILIMLLIGGAIWLSADQVKHQKQWAEDRGYAYADVKAFLSATEFDIDDLKNSEAVFRQFQRFTEGEPMDSQFSKKPSETVFMPVVIAT